MGDLDSAVEQKHILKMARHLRKLATMRRMRLDDIAQALGISRPTVFNHFNGSHRPTLANICGYMQWAWDPYFNETGIARPNIPHEKYAIEALRVCEAAIAAILNGEVR